MKPNTCAGTARSVRETLGSIKYGLNLLASLANTCSWLLLICFTEIAPRVLSNRVRDYYIWQECHLLSRCLPLTPKLLKEHLSRGTRRTSHGVRVECHGQQKVSE